MLEAERIDGVCGVGAVVDFSLGHFKDLQDKLAIYKSQPASSDYDSVLCVKKSLPIELKRKLELAARKVILPNL